MNGQTELEMVLDFLTHNEEFIVFAAMTTCAVFGIVFGTLASVLKSLQRERSRREIAAYIAEGSITAEQGERLMKARPKDA